MSASFRRGGSEAQTEPDRGIDPCLDDAALVARLRSGDEAAFDRFAEAYLPALYRFARARTGGDRELTRDVVQATLCKALAGIASFRGDSSLFTWLCACCRNEIAMHYRRQLAGSRREVPLEEEGEGDGGALALRTPDGSEELERQETVRFVHLALDLLPPHYVRALSWKYLEELPVKEIAQRLAVAPKAAESLLTRARVAFRERYRRLRSDLGSEKRPRSSREDR